MNIKYRAYNISYYYSEKEKVTLISAVKKGRGQKQPNSKQNN